jgi:hypothetical protein
MGREARIQIRHSCPLKEKEIEISTASAAGKRHLKAPELSSDSGARMWLRAS